MSKVDTDVYTFKDDVGKNLYRKRTYYTLVVEQDVLAKDKDEADKLFLDNVKIKELPSCKISLFNSKTSEKINSSNTLDKSVNFKTA